MRFRDPEGLAKDPTSDMYMIYPDDIISLKLTRFNIFKCYFRQLKISCTQEIPKHKNELRYECFRFMKNFEKLKTLR